MILGSDIAKDEIHIILMRNHLSAIIFTMTLVKYAIQKLKRILTIYFAYNSLVITLATDLLNDVSIFLYY
jgi:cation transport ATPase